MDTIAQPAIIGIDVSRDWLDIHCLPSGQRQRLPNTNDGHAQLVDLAASHQALVCFEATGGEERKLWASLDGSGIATRQLPPAQIKAFAASRGTRAKTDRIDAELIARFMAFRPDAGRNLPHQKIRLLRALVSKRGQLVETRKRLLAQIKAHGKLGSADMFEAMDAKLKDLLDHQIAGLEMQIEQTVILDDELATTADILRSVPRIGPVASTMLIAEMPELGQITGEQAAALTGLAPIAHDSGAMRGRRAIGGGRQACDVPGRSRCQPPQSGPEGLRGSSSRGRETAQGCHHSRRAKARHNRERSNQIRPEMVLSDRLRNTVANTLPKTNAA